MKLSQVIDILETLSPKYYAEDWDNPGLIVGDDSAEIKKIMVALDATHEVIDQAIAQQVDLIVTHHPMIFGSVKQINNHSLVGSKVLKLASAGVACYAMHTNFDVKGGMAQLAVERLGLENARPLEVTYEANGETEGIGRIGDLKPTKLRELAQYVKEKYDLNFVMAYGDKDKIVSKIAVCPGSGKSEIGNAIKNGCDCLITGDIGHHDGIDAVDMGLTIIDATHYGLEYVFIDFIRDYLDQELNGVQNSDDVQKTDVVQNSDGVQIVTWKSGCPIAII